jgi:hypothetical protein
VPLRATTEVIRAQGLFGGDAGSAVREPESSGPRFGSKNAERGTVGGHRQACVKKEALSLRLQASQAAPVASECQRRRIVEDEDFLVRSAPLYRLPGADGECSRN